MIVLFRVLTVLISLIDSALADSLDLPLLRSQELQSMEAAIRLGIHEKHLPGGVLWFQHRDNIVHRAFGNRQVDPDIYPTKLDTIYDAASLTKVVATTPAVMWLVEHGKLDLEQPVANYLPKFQGDGKERILVRQLMTHTSGLRPGIRSKPMWTGYETGLDRIWADQLIHEPDTKFVYSDINFILLGELVRQVSGQWLNVFCEEKFFGPLRMEDTGFNPDPTLCSRIAPTTREGDEVVHGIVHDPTSRKMGGITGHAGLFFTAQDVSRYAQMLLNGGELDGVRVLEAETVRQMTSPQTALEVSSLRGLGWDVASSYASLRGAHFTPNLSFGHTGWTGTSLWVDPSLNSFVIFLSNRNHPTEAGRTRDTRYQLSTLAVESIKTLAFNRRDGLWTVKNGVDVMVGRQFRDVRGLTVGLITNHTGRSKKDRSTIDILHESSQVTLKALFGPEHGLRGSAEAGVKVKDGRDAKTGLPVYSLYGESKQPSAAQVEGLNALVFDIQDIGCRFYTYISTMNLAMKVAEEHELKFIVLDRINPIDGLTVDGPMLDGKTSFIATHKIPVRHGMTAGELAILFKKEQGLDKLDLHVIPVEGWRRKLLQSQTDLAWINPSPNIRNLTEALLYPGVGLLEFLKLSVGRGTASPFEVIGAPYLDGKALKTHLDTLKLPGVSFEAITFTPTASIFKGYRCGGLRIQLRDAAKHRCVDTGLAIAMYLATYHANDSDFERFKTLLLHSKTYQMMKNGGSLEAIREAWQPELEAFMERRQRCLLY